jgi:hypothetical protein
MSFQNPKEFYRQFRDDPEAAKRTALQLGTNMGQILKGKHNIQGEDLNAVAEILNAFMRSAQGETAKVEDNKVIMYNTGFCDVMRSALTLNVPWEWLDTNFAWPFLEGVVSAIRPDIKLRVASARCRGEKACIHIFEIK